MNLHDRSDRQRNQARFVNIPLAKGLAASAQIALRRDVIGITDGGHRRAAILQHPTQEVCP